MNGDGEPDETSRSFGVSRRQIVALTAMELGVGFAFWQFPRVVGALLEGMVGLWDSVTGSGASKRRGRTRADQTEQEATATPSLDIQVAVQELTLDSISYELNLGAGSNQDGPFEATVRAYATPNLASDEWQVIAEHEVTQSTGAKTHQLSDPSFEMGYAQRLRFTVEITGGPIQPDETEITRLDEAVIPFYNAAEDTEMLRRGPLRTWEDSNAEIWFNEPDESPFDVPEVSESEYDPSWYQYRDLVVTAFVRFPVLEGYTDDDQPPRQEWGVFNVDLSEWELLEAFRWNSRITLQVESGYYNRYNQEPMTKSLIGQSGVNTETEQLGFPKNGRKAPSPYQMYRKVRYEYDHMWFRANAQSFVTGRTFSKRAAQSIEQSLDNPSFNQLRTQDYHKATALLTFVGTAPYSLVAEGYSKTPEETFNAWYLAAEKGYDVGRHCRDATHTFCSIAAHLLDAEKVGGYGMLHDLGPHEIAGLFGIEIPEGVQTISGNHPWVGAVPLTIDTEFGKMIPVECCINSPVVGFQAWDIEERYGVEAFITEPAINSHVPVDAEFSPSRDGSVLAADDIIEIPWNYASNHNTIKPE